MKVRGISALALASVFVAAACTGTPAASVGTGGSAAPSKGTLKVGVTLPLSGGAAADGQPTLKGAQLAVNQANAAGGDLQIRA